MLQASACVLVALLLAGCASSGCRTGRTGGWLSSWGSGGSSAFTLGLHRAWRDCDERVGGGSSRPSDVGPVPSADPASESNTPSAAGPLR
jgi:hypothetical protein